MRPTATVRATQMAPATRKNQPAAAKPPRQALDLLVISMGNDNDEALQTWESTCGNTGLSFGHLWVDKQAGARSSQKILKLMRSLRDWAHQGKVDRATQIMILGHGYHNGQTLEFSDEEGKLIIADGAAFVRQLREMLGDSAQSPWDGMLYLAPCGGAALRGELMNGPGDTFIFSGHKSLWDRELVASFDQVLRTWSAEPRSAEAPSLKQIRKLWRNARDHCGEHIAWSGRGKIRVHKAGKFDFKDHPLPAKRTHVLYAKLNHGSIDSVKRVVGDRVQETLRNHRYPNHLPLAAAAVSPRDYAEKLEFLIASGELIDEQDANGLSALFVAAHNGRRASLRWLLQHGADPWLADPNGWLAWQIAKSNVLDLLLVDPAAGQPLAPHMPDSEAWPLHAASGKGDLQLLAQLDPQVSDLRTKDDQGNYPLELALQYGQLKMAQALLERGADPNAWTKNKEALLAHAVLHGQTDAARLLLKHGAKPHRSQRHGMPLLLRALHAVHAGRAGMELLDLVLPTDVGQETLKQGRALLYASLLDDAALVRKLLESGSDPTQCDGSGMSAIFFINAAMKTDPQWNSFEMKVALLDAMQRHGVT